MDQQVIIYRIDGSDRILYVNEAWDKFALENSSPELTAPNVLNRLIWDFIEDLTVRSVYRDMLERIRKGNYAGFNFRCDAPEHMRRLMMSVAPMPRGVVEFRSQMIETAARPHVSLLDSDITRTSEVMIACSWCKKIRMNDLWLDIENAVNDLVLFDRSAVPKLSHGICKSCYDEMTGNVILT